MDSFQSLKLSQVEIKNSYRPTTIKEIETVAQSFFGEKNQFSNEFKVHSVIGNLYLIWLM